MYDVVVVGARCAGSPLAMLLARRGHKVLVVDRARFPSDTVSTHFIHQTGLTRLRDWDLLDDLVATGCPPMRHMNFLYTGIELRGFADPVDDITEVYAPRRTALDEVLVRGARAAGADVVEGFTVEDLLVEQGRVVGIRGREGAGRSLEIRAALVVGADGTGSVVADRVGASSYHVVPASCFIYYSYYSGVSWPFHHCTGFGEQQMGAWPTNDDLMLIAVMTKRDRYRAFRTDPEEHFHRIIDEVTPELGEELRDAGRRAERFRPILYPDNFYREAYGPGWALVGDAGYHKDPFTGNGIKDALNHAELLAGAIHRGLTGEQPLDEALAGYATERDESSRHTYEFTCAVSELTLPPDLEAVFRATSHSPEYTRKFFGLVAGSVSGHEFFDPASLAQLYEETGCTATGHQPSTTRSPVWLEAAGSPG